MDIVVYSLSKEILIFSSVIIVSLISLIGITVLSIEQKKFNQFIILMISLAAGAIFGEVFIHLLPESMKEQGTLKTLIFVTFGLVSFFILEKYLIWRNAKNKNSVLPVGQMSIFADGICNFLDGFLIATAYLVSIPLGIATTVAVIFHEIPQEIGEFGILLKSGFSKLQALFFNCVSATLAIFGAFIAVVIGMSFEEYLVYILAFVAGAYIYMFGKGIFPILKEEIGSSKPALQLLAIGIGVGAVLLIACVK